MHQPAPHPIGADALFIDFEGEQSGPPVLLGVLGGAAALGDGAEFRQYVFDPDLQRAGMARSTGHGPCMPMTALEALRRLRAAVEQSGLPVFAWSSYEQTAILDLVGPGDDARFWDGRIVDAKAIAKRWKRRAHPQVEFPRTPGAGRHALRHYLRLIGYEIPPTQQGGKTGARIRAVREALQTRGAFEALTPTQKRKWASLLEHNWHDCNGMREVLRIAEAGVRESG